MISILALDKNYEPHQWLNLEHAMILEAKGQVLDHLGEESMTYHGGINRISGNQSSLSTNSIIVVDGFQTARKYKPPVLTNSALFQRDCNLCAYCGKQFAANVLTRDHVIPTSGGGLDIWMNVVTACKSCNNLKDDLMPGEMIPRGLRGPRPLGPQGNGYMNPIYIPYIPCKAENLLMKNRKIKADQMAFLLDRIKHKSTSRIYQSLS